MKRLSVNINDHTAVALEDLAVTGDVTVTEVIRRAVSVYKFVMDETDAGKTLQIHDGTSTTTLKVM
jgi:hypothetical protein